MRSHIEPELRRTPTQDLNVRAARLLREIRSRRAELLQTLEGMRVNTALTLRTVTWLQNQFTDIQRQPEIQAAARRLKTLSRRQQQVLDKVIAGLANKTIAFDLELSEKTVETHRARLMRKLGVASLADLMRIAMRAR